MSITAAVEVDGIVYKPGKPYRKPMEDKETARRREAAKMSLMMIGMSPNHIGYYYLAECIALAAKAYHEGDWMVYVGKLMEQVAIEHHKKTEAVERCIRYAIDQSYAAKGMTAGRIINTIADMIG